MWRALVNGWPAGMFSPETGVEVAQDALCGPFYPLKSSSNGSGPITALVQSRPAGLIKEQEQALCAM